MSAIHIQNLRKTYGGTVAIEDLSLDVKEGEIFGLVGPNGAGKTTAVEAMIGLRRPDRGEVRVLGLDPQAQGRALRQRIGVQLQEAALPPRLTVEEALDLYASFYEKTADADRLLERWGLNDHRGAAFEALSGGQKQRLFIALALLNEPDLAFLDEITTGLDPEARRSVRALIRGVRERGVTVVLVTHFMNEAEALCDRVAVMDAGRLAGLDTPQALVEQAGENGRAEQRITFSSPNGFDPGVLRSLEGVAAVERTGAGRVTVRGPAETLLLRVATTLDAHDCRPPDLRAHRATLEDAFLEMTRRGERERARKRELTTEN